MIYRFLVSGRVQGVYYRKYTSDRLRRLGVTGYIQNLPDGRVEALIDPHDIELDKILSALRKGSNLSSVKSIEYQRVDNNIQYDDFYIKY